jgi:hypothetical protein
MSRRTRSRWPRFLLYAAVAIGPSLLVALVAGAVWLHQHRQEQQATDPTAADRGRPPQVGEWITIGGRVEAVHADMDAALSVFTGVPVKKQFSGLEVRYRSARFRCMFADHACDQLARVKEGDAVAVRGLVSIMDVQGGLCVLSECTFAEK